MLTITEYVDYNKVDSRTYEYVTMIKFEWDKGFLEIPKKKWDKLPKYKQDLIYKKAEEKPRENNLN